jgi:flagellar protein FliS
MTTKDVANNYRRLRARSSSPVGLVILLYDAAIESLRQAKLAAAEARIEDRVAASNHVMLVLNELTRTLDHERGGKVAHNLERFYAVAGILLTEANVRSDPATFDKLIGMFCTVREGWQRVEQEVGGWRPASAAETPLSASEPSLVGWRA